MKRSFIILWISILFIQTGSSQILNTPTWNTGMVYIETAKISKWNFITNRWGPESYKTSKIIIENANQSNPKITVDIPDSYFISDAEVIGMKYEKDIEGRETMTYSIHVQDK